VLSLRRASCVRWLASSSLQLWSWQHCTCDTAWQAAIRRRRSRLKPPKLASVPRQMSGKGLLSDQARNGLDTGQMHVPDSLTPRWSILSADGANGFSERVPGSANGTRASSVPPIEYSRARSPQQQMAPCRLPSKCAWTSTNGRGRRWKRQPR
jgi:hypothetical protein